MSNIINAYNDSAHHVIQNNILKEDTKNELFQKKRKSYEGVSQVL